MRPDEGDMKHGCDDLVSEALRSGNNEENTQQIENDQAVEVQNYKIDETPPRDTMNDQGPPKLSAELTKKNICRFFKTKEDMSRFFEVLIKIAKHLFPHWYNGHWIIKELEIVMPYIKKFEKQCVLFISVCVPQLTARDELANRWTAT